MLRSLYLRFEKNRKLYWICPDLPFFCEYVFLPFCYSKTTSDENLLHFFLIFVKSRELKLGTHLDNGWMYHVYGNPDATAYFVPYFLHYYYCLHFSGTEMSFFSNCTIAGLQEGVCVCVCVCVWGGGGGGGRGEGGGRAIVRSSDSSGLYLFL